MDSKEIKSRLQISLGKIHDCNERIKQNDKVSRLETDLLLDFIRNLYDEVLCLQRCADLEIANTQDIATDTICKNTDTKPVIINSSESVIVEPQTEVVQDTEVVSSESELDNNEPKEAPIVENDTKTTDKLESKAKTATEITDNKLDTQAIEEPKISRKEAIAGLASCLEKEKPQATETEPVVEHITQEPEHIISEPEPTIVKLQDTTPNPEKEQPKPEPKKEKGQASLFDYLNPEVSTAAESVGKTISTKTIADTFKETKTIASSAQKNASENAPVSAPINKKKYGNIRTLIGINDKFTFINDLFAGDMRKYSDFIATLDGIEYSDKAQNYIQEIAIIHDWNKESIAVQLFLSVFKRQYSTNLILN